MANDLTLHVKTTSDGKGLDQTADKLDKTTTATDKTRKATDKLGDSFHDTTTQLRDYNEQLRRLYAERADLARSYQESGDRELLVDFNRANRRIGLLEKLRKAIGDGMKVGAATTAPFTEGISGVGRMSLRNPAVIAGLGAVTAGALPPLGAMIGGAFSGTVVGAAMAGGILSAIKEPAVKSAAEAFGDRVSAEFFSGGKTFAGPVIKSLDILGDAVEDMNLGDTFAKVAPQVTTVADGIGRMGKNLVSGLNPTLDRSAAFTREFSDGMADLGWALATMIDRMSASEGSVEGLNVLFKLVNGTLVVVGNTVNGLADIFDAFTDVGAKVTGVLQDLPEPLQMAFFGHAGFSAANDVFEDLNKSTFDVTQGFGRTTGELADLAGATKRANEELQELEDTVGRLIGDQFELEEAQDAVAESTARLKEQLKEQRKEGVAGAGMLTGNTQAARDNREMVRGLAEDYARLIVELEQEGKSSAQAQLQFEALLVSMGFGEAEAKRYAESLKALRAELDKIRSKEITVTVKTQTVETYLRSGAGGRNVIDGLGARGFASGGTTPAFQPFYTHPGETMWSDRAHYVATKQQTADLARMGAGSGGLPRVVIDFTGAPEELKAWLRKTVRVEGGGSVQTTFGTG